MNDKQIDELINKVLREDQTLPEGLSERLEQQIDAWAAAEKKETIRSSFRRRSLYWLSGAAAVALLCIMRNTNWQIRIPIRKKPPWPPRKHSLSCL